MFSICSPPFSIDSRLFVIPYWDWLRGWGSYGGLLLIFLFRCCRCLCGLLRLGTFVDQFERDGMWAAFPPLTFLVVSPGRPFVTTRVIAVFVWDRTKNDCIQWRLCTSRRNCKDRTYCRLLGSRNSRLSPGPASGSRSTPAMPSSRCRSIKTRATKCRICIFVVAEVTSFFSYQQLNFLRRWALSSTERRIAILVDTLCCPASASALDIHVPNSLRPILKHPMSAAQRCSSLRLSTELIVARGSRLWGPALLLRLRRRPIPTLPELRKQLRS